MARKIWFDLYSSSIDRNRSKVTWEHLLLGVYAFLFLGLWIASFCKITIFSPLVDQGIQCASLLTFVFVFLFKLKILKSNDLNQ